MEIYRAIVRHFDPATWRADLELAGAHTALLTGVPVAADLGEDLVSPGTRVWVCLSGEGNPADGTVLVPYGAPPSPWVTSRLLRPTLATAERTAPAPCSSAAFDDVPGLALSLTLVVEGTVLLLLAATGSVGGSGASYTLALYHDDEHETTQLAPMETVGGPGADGGESWNLSWWALQAAVAAGTHTFLLKHCASGGEGVLVRGRVLAVVTGI